MNISKLTDDGLLSLYNAITTALREDDAIREGRPKKHGVRRLPDWREWGDALQAEIKKRRLPYNPIPW